MLGRANGSAAWLVGIAATAASLARRGSEQVQAEIFGSSKHRLAGSLDPGSVRRVTGGLSTASRHTAERRSRVEPSRWLNSLTKVTGGFRTASMTF
jgi:hypothetical protein